MKDHTSLPYDVVEPVLQSFASEDPRERKIADSLKDLVSRQTFDAFGQMRGPKLNVTAVALKAGLSRELVSHDGCALPKARELIIQILKLLADYSREVECECLKQEVKRLRARLDRQDSILANRVVALHKEKIHVVPTSSSKYSAQDVRRSVRVVPIDEV